MKYLGALSFILLTGCHHHETWDETSMSHFENCQREINRLNQSLEANMINERFIFHDH